MADYPGDIYDPRVIENMPNVVYDAGKKTVFYAEDHNALNDEVVAIETLLGVFAPTWPVPAVALFEALVKFWLSQSRLHITLAIGSGLIAPESFNLALVDPLGLGRSAEIVASGGAFLVTAPPNPIKTYQIVLSVMKLGPTTFRFLFKYLDVGTTAFVSPLAIPFGAVISGDPGFTYDIRWI